MVTTETVDFVRNIADTVHSVLYDACDRTSAFTAEKISRMLGGDTLDIEDALILAETLETWRAVEQATLKLIDDLDMMSLAAHVDEILNEAIDR